MDPTRFTDGKTGQLVAIEAEDGPDVAFIPDPLPPKGWQFPDRLWPVLSRAREQLIRLDLMGQRIGNPSLLLAPLQKGEAIRSSSIEGTYATAKELLLFELAPREPASSTDKANDWQEVANYDRALQHGAKNLLDKTPEGLPLSLRLIKDMHEILMAGARGQHGGKPGQFRDQHVYVGSARKYVPPPPGPELMKCLEDMEKYMHAHGDQFDPLVLAFLLHYQFEAIHPFRDGNGRIGRLLLALTIFQWFPLHLPWLYMSAFFERFKDEYVDNMFRVSTHGDWDRWIEYCLTGVEASAKQALARCEQLAQLRDEMHEKLDRLPRMAVLIDRIFVRPVFSTAEFRRWTNTTHPTARRDIEALVAQGYVEHLDGVRPKSYYVPRIFSIAFPGD